MYKYQTGKFPHSSSQRNIYHIIIHDIDINYTWVEPQRIEKRKKQCFGKIWSLKRTKLCGIIPKHQVLDNEASKAYKDSIPESVMIYQLLPPYGHRQNVAE